MIVESVKGLGENRSLATIIIFRVTPMVALALLIISYLTVDATEQAVERQLRDHLRRENDHALSVIDGRLDSIHAVGRAFARNELVVNALFDPENRDNSPALFRNPSLPGSAKARVTLVDYREDPLFRHSGTPFEAGSVYCQALSRGEEDFHVDGGEWPSNSVPYAGFPMRRHPSIPPRSGRRHFRPRRRFSFGGDGDRTTRCSIPRIPVFSNRADQPDAWKTGLITLERALRTIRRLPSLRPSAKIAPTRHKRLTNLWASPFAVLVALIWGWRPRTCRGQVDFIAIIGGIGRAEDRETAETQGSRRVSGIDRRVQ